MRATNEYFEKRIKELGIAIQVEDQERRAIFARFGIEESTTLNPDIFGKSAEAFQIIVDDLNNQSFDDLDNYLKYQANWKAANDAFLRGIGLDKFVRSVKNKEILLSVLHFFSKYGTLYFENAKESRSMPLGSNYADYLCDVVSVTEFIEAVKDRIELVQSTGEFSITDVSTGQSLRIEELEGEIKLRDGMIKALQEANARLKSQIECLNSQVPSSPNDEFDIFSIFKQDVDESTRSHIIEYIRNNWEEKKSPTDIAYIIHAIDSLLTTTIVSEKEKFFQKVCKTDKSIKYNFTARFSHQPCYKEKVAKHKEALNLK